MTIEDALCDLTERISEKHPGTIAHGVLGGTYGYGCNYKDDNFIMHPFCWCDLPDCPWCYRCNCERISISLYEEPCDWCKSVHKHEDNGSFSPDIYPHAGAPNFWDKKTGLRIWWYKYIGRGMEMHVPDGIEPEKTIRNIIKMV